MFYQTSYPRHPSAYATAGPSYSVFAERRFAPSPHHPFVPATSDYYDNHHRFSSAEAELTRQYEQQLAQLQSRRHRDEEAFRRIEYENELRREAHIRYLIEQEREADLQRQRQERAIEEAQRAAYARQRAAEEAQRAFFARQQAARAAYVKQVQQEKLLAQHRANEQRRLANLQKQHFLQLVNQCNRSSANDVEVSLPFGVYTAKAQATEKKEERPEQSETDTDEHESPLDLIDVLIDSVLHAANDAAKAEKASQSAGNKKEKVSSSKSINVTVPTEEETTKPVNVACQEEVHADLVSINDRVTHNVEVFERILKNTENDSDSDNSSSSTSSTSLTLRSRQKVLQHVQLELEELYGMLDKLSKPTTEEDKNLKHGVTALAVEYADKVESLLGKLQSHIKEAKQAEATQQTSEPEIDIAPQNENNDIVESGISQEKVEQETEVINTASADAPGEESVSDETETLAQVEKAKTAEEVEETEEMQEVEQQAADIHSSQDKEDFDLNKSETPVVPTRPESDVELSSARSQNETEEDAQKEEENIEKSNDVEIESDWSEVDTPAASPKIEAAESVDEESSGVHTSVRSVTVEEVEDDEKPF